MSQVKELHGCAPRDLIYAEQLGQSNPIYPKYVDDFFDDDCPICQAERENIAYRIGQHGHLMLQ